MSRRNENRALPEAGGRAVRAGAEAANPKVLAAVVLMMLVFLLVAACDPTGLTRIPVASTTRVASPSPAARGSAPTRTVAASAPATPFPSFTPAATPAAANTQPPAPASKPTVAEATTTAALPTALPDSVASAIKNVIQRANDEEVQAFDSNKPSVMADTATAPYYQQMVQSYNEMTNSGIKAVKLLKLIWGPITLTNATTAQANTTETWQTTFSDGSTMQETDANVYTLVSQNGAWKVQDDQHPNTRTLQPQPGTPGAAASPAAPNPAAPTPIASIVPPGSSVEQSSNWAGYTATGGTFTTVSAAWTVPNVSAGTGNSVASDATWTGIGGANSTDLIQAGTQADVQGNQVVYTAWWETLPQAAQTVPLDIAAGDRVSVLITLQAGSTWLIVIRDATSGQSFQKKLTYNSSRSSAEWIEESPTVGRRTLLPLDNFGTVTFTNATTTENGKQRTIAQAGGKPVTMYGSSQQGRRGRFGQPGGQSGQAGQPLAQPSALGADGASFSVTRTNVPAPVVVP